MRAYITKITQETGRNGSQFHICFHGINPDKSYDAYVVTAFRNYQNWRKYIEAFLKGAQVWLDGLCIIKANNGRDNMISADSPFFPYRIIWPQPEIREVIDNKEIYQERK